jgi:P27 family predicted phage terminase small subunit
MCPTRRKSNAQLKITGSQFNEDEETLAPGVPRTPDDLTPCELIEWDAITELLFNAGRLTQLDGGSLKAYCRSVCEWNAAYADLQKFGYYSVAGTGAQKLSAQLNRFNLTDRCYQRWCSELGLSPKSRPLAVVQEGEGESESLEDILSGDDIDQEATADYMRKDRERREKLYRDIAEHAAKKEKE